MFHELVKSIQYSSSYFTNSAENKETVALYGLCCGLLVICASVHHNWHSNFSYVHIISFFLKASKNHWEVLLYGKSSAVLLHYHDPACCFFYQSRPCWWLWLSTYRKTAYCLMLLIFTMFVRLPGASTEVKINSTESLNVQYDHQDRDRDRDNHKLCENSVLQSQKEKNFLHH